jgi:BppU N-terminal domain
VSDVTVVQGDHGTILTATLTHTSDGSALDLTTAASVYFQMRKSDDRRYTVNAACTIVDAATGQVSYTWDADDLSNAGDYICQFEVRWSGGAVQTTDPVGTITVRRQ